MKRRMRILALVLAVFCLCATLSGCKYLDNMRANHAKWIDVQTILWNDTEYKLLPKSDELRPIYDNYDNIYVTETDVPVLLSRLMGEWMEPCNEGLLLKGDNIYCRADKYDEIVKRIQEGFVPDGCYYPYVDYESEYWDTLYYELKTDELEAVENVLATVQGEVLPEIAYPTYDYLIELELCTKDLLFSQHYVDIFVINDSYYLVDYVEDDMVMYEVPDDMNDIFGKITKFLVESEDDYWGKDYWDEEEDLDVEGL